METIGVNSKRFRSSSVSGRLRAVSDLEDMGWIDKNQKGLIKDLIISGDTTLRSALDKYEKGDAHELEGIILLFELRSNPSPQFHQTNSFHHPF
jgi:hypothetical protein